MAFGVRYETDAIVLKHCRHLWISFFLFVWVFVCVLVLFVWLLFWMSAFIHWVSVTFPFEFLCIAAYLPDKHVLVN